MTINPRNTNLALARKNLRAAKNHSYETLNKLAWAEPQMYGDAPVEAYKKIKQLVKDARKLDQDIGKLINSIKE